MNILFVCNGNVARSQEAEALFNSLQHNQDTKAMSGGVNVKIGKLIDPLVVEVMRELGYDMSQAKRKFVTEEMVQAADKIISFKPAEELPEFIRSLDNITFWEVDDPQRQSIEFHRYVRDEIQKRVNKLHEELNN